MPGTNTEDGRSTPGGHDQAGTKTRARSRRRVKRFAFYGCAPHGSLTGSPAEALKEMQLSNAREVIEACHGEIVAEYFDTYKRHSTAGGPPPETHRPWGQRPQARALIGALNTKDFDAVVIGDLTPATFGATSVWEVVGLLRYHGKFLWIPGNEEPLNPANPVHTLLVKVLIGLPDPQPRRAQPR
ncbi:hypothetical protein Acsp04_65110 [Actinomadura sp. NBRC 104425]|uniref:hypothetical protein n=1 Tax=Actinomadura sp. NBRC 104425 TaxID=3032204 RepID=UPI00249FD125|nr:hypothetical protein [Actinomadura sp. NBRC 104425]GLZ16276.1 hypothetical protein Acsp04_65110 [Actinomadura sp. NBRC 104425]